MKLSNQIKPICLTSTIFPGIIIVADHETVGLIEDWIPGM
jgi:hypothetical protein